MVKVLIRGENMRVIGAGEFKDWNEVVEWMKKETNPTELWYWMFGGEIDETDVNYAGENRDALLELIKKHGREYDVTLVKIALVVESPNGFINLDTGIPIGGDNE